MQQYTWTISSSSPTVSKNIRKKLEAVLTTLGDNDISLSKAKCIFAQESVDYLGHKSSSQGIGLQSNKVEAITNAKPPSNIPAVPTFLGAVGFYRRIIKNFAHIALSLQKLSSAKDFEWKEEHIYCLD